VQRDTALSGMRMHAKKKRSKAVLSSEEEASLPAMGSTYVKREVNRSSIKNMMEHRV